MVKDELTYQIIGCAMKVHKTLGNGFQEVIYQRCLAIELERAGIGPEVGTLLSLIDFGREVEQKFWNTNEYSTLKSILQIQQSSKSGF